MKDAQMVATRWKGALWASEPAGRRLPKVGLLAALGAAILLSVGWITPLGKSFFAGGTDVHTVWLSLTDVQPSAWIRLVAFDTAFGAGAGLIAYGVIHGVATVAAQRRRRRSEVLAPAASPP